MGQTALLQACQYGYEHLAIALLQQGALVDVQDQDGNTPLLLACKCGNISLVETLLCHGANVCIKNQVSITSFIDCSYGY